MRPATAMPPSSHYASFSSAARDPAQLVADDLGREGDEVRFWRIQPLSRGVAQ